MTVRIYEQYLLSASRRRFEATVELAAAGKRGGHVGRRGGQGEDEFGALLFGFDPDAPTVPLDDPLANGETDTGPRNLCVRVQPLKHDEDTSGGFGRDPNTLVTHRNQPLVLFFFDADIDLRRPSTRKFQGVGEQVFQE